MYRVLCELTVGASAPATSIIWQGDMAEDLSQKYPPSEIFGADPLDHFSCSDFYKNYRFEQLVNGDWVEIDDPRVRVTPMTALEEVIEAENRRRYPGDYIEVDCDTYDDDVYEALDDDPDLCCICDEVHDYYAMCDVMKINLEKIQKVDVRDGCTVYNHPYGDYVIVQGERRLAIEQHRYKGYSSPLYWLREAAAV